MDRIVRIDASELEHSLRLEPLERLRQANAAFRLYHALHKPHARPFLKGFDSLEDFFRFEKEAPLPL